MSDMEEIIEKVCRAMHDAYEAAAKLEGWKTQESCQVPFDDLPEANRRTMRASAMAAIEALTAAGYGRARTKELEWDDKRDGGIVPAHNAKTPFGPYRIAFSDKVGDYLAYGRDMAAISKPTLEAAKAACQADFQKRYEACGEVAPGSDVLSQAAHDVLAERACSRRFAPPPAEG